MSRISVYDSAMMREIPVERRVYFPHPLPADAERRPCPACGQTTLTPWYLRRDQERRVWRRWVCVACAHQQDIEEEQSA
jgi:hypothetical protein